MKTILIIEDDEPFRYMVAELLTGAGYRTLSATGGQHGLRLARAHHPDLILTDVRMPGTDGHRVLAELRQMPGFDSVPMVIMTGHAALPDMRRSMTLGADDYLPKPFDNAELLRVVHQHLERAGQRKREADRELRSLRQSLGRFLPQEFVGPLHDIIGCAAVLAVDAAVMPPTEVREFARSIEGAAAGLHRQIENLMLYAQLDEGLPAATPRPPEAIAPVVREAAEAAARRHRRLDTLRLELEDVVAPVAREPLAKIVTEVIDHACRQAAAETPVEVVLAAAGDRWLLQVTVPQPAALAARSEPDATGSRTAATSSELGFAVAERLTQHLGGGWENERTATGALKLQLTFLFAPPTAASS